MDLDSFDHHETSTVRIKDPLGRPTDIEVTVYGRDSKQGREAALSVAREYENTDNYAERGAVYIQRCIESWSNVEYKGEAVEPHSEAAKSMLMDESLDWFTSQITQAITDRSRFFSERGKS